MNQMKQVQIPIHVLQQSDFMICKKCGGKDFTPVINLKYVPRLMFPELPQDATISVPGQYAVCVGCQTPMTKDTMEREGIEEEEEEGPSIIIESGE